MFGYEVIHYGQCPVIISFSDSHLAAQSDLCGPNDPVQGMRAESFDKDHRTTVRVPHLSCWRHMVFNYCRDPYCYVLNSSCLRDRKYLFSNGH